MNQSLNNNFSSALFLRFILFCLLLSACHQEGQFGENGGGDQSTEEVLGSLGVETDLGPREGLNGEPISDGIHPLGSQITSLSRVAELAIIGAPTAVTPDDTYAILDEPVSVQPRNLITAQGDTAWTSTQHMDVVSGDIDADGFEELLIAYYLPTPQEIVLRYIEDQSEGSIEQTVTLVSGMGDVDLAGYSETSTPALDLESGDFDGDGSDEIALAFGPLSTIYVFEGQVNNFQPLNEIPVPNAFPDLKHVIRIETGDVNSSGRENIVMTESSVFFIPWYAVSEITSQIFVYELEDNSWSELYSGMVANRSVELTDTALVLGDFDADHLPEIALLGHDSSLRCSLLVMEDGRGMTPDGANSSPFSFVEFEDHTVHCPEQPTPVAGVVLTHAKNLAVFSGNFDDDPQDEVIVNGLMYEIEDGSIVATEGWDAFDSGSAIWTQGYVSVADFDGEPGERDEIALFSFHGRIDIVGKNSSGEFAVLNSVALGQPVVPMLASVNIDDDSIVVEYASAHELVFSDPVVLSVLASAPYYEGLNHADGSTTLGDTTTISLETALAVGGSVGFSIGAKAEAPMFGSTAFEAEAKVTVELSAEFVLSSSFELQNSHSISNPSGQDLVVFTAIPYDLYFYTVLSSPDPEDVGQVISVQIPRPAGVHHLEREYYNAHNGDGVDIDETVLTHQVGDPQSYATAQEMNEITTNLSNNPYLVPLRSNRTESCSGGNAESTLGIELTAGVGFGFSTEVSVTSELQVVTGGVLVGASSEYYRRTEIALFFSGSTFIEGTVGDISREDYRPELTFDWGVFSYTGRAGGQRFPVVTYWVE